MLKALILGLLIGASAHAAEGLPLPWPFPWAQECDINWQQMEGRYLLDRSTGEQQIQLSIRVIYPFGIRMLQVARLNAEGDMLAMGLEVLDQHSTYLKMTLEPRTPDEVPMIAEIKLYFQSDNRNCGATNLVPIMTMRQRDVKDAPSTSYVLLKIEEEGES